MIAQAWNAIQDLLQNSTFDGAGLFVLGGIANGALGKMGEDISQRIGEEIKQKINQKYRSILRKTSTKEAKIDQVMAQLKQDVEKDRPLRELVEKYTLLSLKAKNNIDISGDMKAGRDLKLDFHQEVNLAPEPVRASPKRVGKAGQVDSLPPDIFLGREKSIKEIAECLINDSKRPLLISGVGGIGKTALVKKYIEQYEEEYDHIYWIDYQDNLLSSITRQLAQELGIYMPSPEETFVETMKKLSKYTGRNLLVIDSFDNLADIGSLHRLPLKGFEKIVTARLDVAIESTVPIKLLGLRPPDAREMFLRLYFATPEGRIPQLSEDMDGKLAKLLEKVGFHPLAIEVAAKTLTQNPDLSFQDLLSFKDNIEIKVRHEIAETSLGKFLAQLFNASSVSDDGLRVLKNFAVLPSQPYPEWLIKGGLVLHHDNAAPKAYRLTSEQYITALRELVGSGWLTLEARKVEGKRVNFISCHEIVQAFILKERRPQYKDYELMAAYLTVLLARYSEGTSTISLRILLVVESVLGYTGAVQNDATLNMLIALGVTLRNLHYTREALGYELRAAAIREGRHKAKTDIMLAKIYTTIGHIYMDLRDRNFDKALEYYEKAQGIYDKVVSIEEPSAGQLRQVALNAYKTTEEIGKNEPSLSAKERSSLSGLAYLKYNIGQLFFAIGNSADGAKRKVALEEAIKYYLTSLWLHAKVSVDPLMQAKCFGCLSTAYLCLGSPEQSLGWSQSEIEIYKEYLPADHPDLVRAYLNLSYIYDGLNFPKEHLVYVLKAISAQEKAAIPAQYNSLLADAYEILTHAYGALGKRGLARKAAAELVRMKKNIQPKDEIAIAEAYYVLASVEVDLRMTRKAQEHVSLAIGLTKGILSDASPLSRSILQLEEIIDLFPRANKIKSSLELKNGQKSFAGGDYRAAIVHCRLAILYNPANVEAFWIRGKANAFIGRFAAAIADYDTIIKSNQKIGVAYYNRGVAKASLGQNKEAVIDYTRAIESGFDSFIVYERRAKLRNKIDKSDNAKDDYEKASELKLKLVKFNSSLLDRLGLSSLPNEAKQKLLVEMQHDFEFGVKIRSSLARSHLATMQQNRPEPIDAHNDRAKAFVRLSSNPASNADIAFAEFEKVCSKVYQNSANILARIQKVENSGK